MDNVLEEENTEEYYKDMKKMYMEGFGRRISNEFLLYNRHFDINESNYIHFVNCANDTMPLTEKELEEVVKESKKILKEEHGIIILKDNPIRYKQAVTRR